MPPKRAVRRPRPVTSDESDVEAVVPSAEGRLRASRPRVWSVTIHCEDGQLLPTLPTLNIGSPLLFYRYQLERCPRTGRLHYQGCLRYDRPMSLEAVKADIGVPHAHLEGARNWQDLLEYCRKAESRVDGPWEAGDPGKQGKRSDIADAVAALKEGGYTGVAEKFPVVAMKFSRGLRDLDAALNVAKPRPDQKVYLLYGPTGTGKTDLCHRIFPDIYCVADMKHPWFDGYNRQAHILLDEMGPDMMCINSLKKLLDKYKHSVPVKGGFVPLCTSVIMITSNYTLDEWYPRAKPMDYLALARRVRQFHIDSYAAADACELTIRQELGMPPLAVAGPPPPPLLPSATQRMPPDLEHVSVSSLSSASGIMPLPVRSVLSVLSSSDDSSEHSSQWSGISARPLDGLL